MRKPLTDEEQNLRLVGNMDRYADWQFEVLSPYISGNVLEIGGGIGTMSSKIISHPRVSSFSVTEINPKNLYALRKRLGKRCAFFSFDISKGVSRRFLAKFDTVISANVMEHVKDDRAFFRNCCKCLKNGGRIVKLVPALRANFGSLDRSDSHYRRYEKQDLSALAAENGLEVLRLFPMNFAGALGWFYHGKVLKKTVHPDGDLALFNRLIPAIKIAEAALGVPFGLNLILVAEKKSGS